MSEFRPSRPGERRGGRQKGTPNATTRDLRAAIMIAAENVGRPIRFKNGRLAKGAGGLVGYLEHVALTNSTSFTGLLGRVLPARVEVEGSVTFESLILGATKALGARERKGQVIEGHVVQSQPAAISKAAQD